MVLPYKYLKKSITSIIYDVPVNRQNNIYVAIVWLKKIAHLNKLLLIIESLSFSEKLSLISLTIEEYSSIESSHFGPIFDEKHMLYK